MDKNNYWKWVLSACAILIVVMVALYLLTDLGRAVPVYSSGAVMKEVGNEQKSVLIADQPSEGESQIPEAPEWAVPLGEGEVVGYTYSLGKKGPWNQSVPEGGFVLISCGNCTVDGIKATSDGTEGNTFLFKGTNSDGLTPDDLNETIVIKDYAAGHVQVTFIYAGNEVPEEAALAAVANMFFAPNCGQDGCSGGVTLYSRSVDAAWESEVFLDPPDLDT